MWIKSQTDINEHTLNNIQNGLRMFSSHVLDIKQLFGSSVAEDAVNCNGSINYMKVYDLLDEGNKKRFERFLYEFNQEREVSLETEGFDSNVANISSEDVKMMRFNSLLSQKKSWLSTLAYLWYFSLNQQLDLLLKNVEPINAGRNHPQARTKPNEREQAIRAVSDSGASAKTSSIAGDILDYEHIVNMIGIDQLSMITALEMVYFIHRMSRDNDNSNNSLSSNNSHFVSSIVQHLGKAVEISYMNSFISRKELDIDRAAVSFRQQYRLLSLHPDYNKLTPVDKTRLGSILLTLALESFKVSERPAFWHSFELFKNNLVGVIRVNHELIKKMTSYHHPKAPLLTLTLPMLVPPRPWASSTQGGYWYYNQSLLTSVDRQAPEQIAYLEKAIAEGRMDSVLTGLDAVGKCAWAVNDKMLDIIWKIWQSGEPFLSIPAHVNTEVKTNGSSTHKSTKRKNSWWKTARLMDINTLSSRLSMGYIFEIAKEYAQHGEKFYYPAKIDFRGRVYPLSRSGFWHFGMDPIRSLFMFWYGKPLGKQGLRWLKIHLATLYGKSRLSHSERVDFVDKNLAEIQDSAEKPLEGNMWWTQGDKPFQVLAACIEIDNAIKSGDPTTFISRLAVNQDGSCNGLQHYAALGRDSEGAAQVNLMQSDAPGDIYSKVLDIVNDQLQSIRRSSRHDREWHIAGLLQGKLTRVVVKQSVMTSVYGVTRFGMVQQVMDKLEDILENVSQDIEDDDLEITPLEGSRLVAKLIARAIRTLFYGAHEIQAWLEECSIRICKSIPYDYHSKDLLPDKDFLKKYVVSMIYTSPMGLPVVQPYRISKMMTVRTKLQAVSIVNPFELSYVNINKQKNGIAPNYIHTLDSCHMLMTAQECVKNNINFAAVHDSFWTHAADVDKMNEILRYKFIELHEQDLVGDLRKEFMERYAGNMQVVYLEQGQKGYQEVLKYREKLKQKLSKESGKKVTEMTMLRYELKLEGLRYTRRKMNSSVKGLDTPSSILEEMKCKAKFEGREKLLKDYDSEQLRVEEDFNTIESKELNELNEDGEDHEDHENVSEDLISDDRKSRNHKKLIRLFVPIEIPKVPNKGSLQLDQVLESRYFFS